eukprot:CAMPEP_0181300974 /NCGR_PEP_ID=MMETSP1101-20121128/7178_1 /TAXON_ID=46948 /ORGANISM="Rhodomonas abbreviata, Strain Caron Lab Isolate" /LENGTH=221 /DNA_ID=CAMNT_0023406251 /DNA_START=274 /DNA_END=938 /DNA_ORIENTATION=-
MRERGPTLWSGCDALEQLVLSQQRASHAGAQEPGSKAICGTTIGPFSGKMEEIIMSLVKDMRDAATIIVTSTVSILKFVENEGIPLCKDQFLRMISVAVCVNAKFWDDEQAGRLLNARIASASSIPLDEFNCMELSFMRGLNWELHISNEDFCSWVSQLEATSDDQKLEAARRNPSPHSSTDLVDMISDFGLASFSSTSSAPQELKAEGLQESILGATAST